MMYSLSTANINSQFLNPYLTSSLSKSLQVSMPDVPQVVGVDVKLCGRLRHERVLVAQSAPEGTLAARAHVLFLLHRLATTLVLETLRTSMGRVQTIMLNTWIITKCHTIGHTAEIVESVKMEINPLNSCYFSNLFIVMIFAVHIYSDFTAND